MTACARLGTLHLAQRTDLVAVRSLDRRDRALEDVDHDERVACGDQRQVELSAAPGAHEVAPESASTTRAMTLRSTSLRFFRAVSRSAAEARRSMLRSAPRVGRQHGDGVGGKELALAASAAGTTRGSWIGRPEPARTTEDA